MMTAASHSRASQFVPAPPEAVWEAFMDPEQLVGWLPPAGMRGQIHAFDARVGGGYRMSLFYPAEEQGFRGKSAEMEDRVGVRFIELTPPRRIVEAVTFETDDPAFMGQMRLTITLEPRPGGTEVAMMFEDLPPGLRPEDNDEGARLSLAQLATRFA